MNLIEPLEPRIHLSTYGWAQNSEYMVGTVHAQVVLMESNGNAENWTATEIAQVKSEVNEALRWWEQAFKTNNPGSNHTLTFTADFTHADKPVPTKYEPIQLKRLGDEQLWIDDFLTHTGYQTSDSYRNDMRKFNFAQRTAKGTDWSFTIFVIDSSADVDGKFADGQFAFGLYGGPYLTVTYDNGAWGIDRMGQVIAHEMGHIFYALDEYPGSDPWTAYSKGPVPVQNLNAYDGNPDPASRVPSLMAEGSLQKPAYANFTSSPSSLRMIGWIDDNANGYFDNLEPAVTEPEPVVTEPVVTEPAPTKPTKPGKGNSGGGKGGKAPAPQPSALAQFLEGTQFTKTSLKRLF